MSGSSGPGGTALAAPPATVRARPGSRTARTLGRATRWTAARPSIWPVGLAAFLARGGVLVFVLPFVVLPTPIGIASFVGADAVTAAGPTERFLALALVAGLATGAAAVAGAVLAAAADRVALLAWAVDDAGPAGRASAGRASAHPWPAVARILVARVVAAIPCALAIAWAVPRIADATYRQLTLPDDLTTPIILRIVQMVPDAVALVVAGLLVGELVAGLATVHVVVGGRGAGRSLLLVGRDVVRRPIPVLVAFVAGIAVLIAGVGVPLAAGLAAWDAVRRALADGGTPAMALAAATAFAAAMVAALVVAGAVAAWRRATLAEAVADLG